MGHVTITRTITFRQYAMENGCPDRDYDLRRFYQRAFWPRSILFFDPEELLSVPTIYGEVDPKTDYEGLTAEGRRLNDLSDRVTAYENGESDEKRWPS